MSQKHCPLPPSVMLPYRGGHTVVRAGYRFELCPDHPKANPFGFVPQHRLVVERELGRYLLPGEHVHHRDFSKDNNDPANLQVLSRREHMRLHRAQKYKLAHGEVDLTADMVREALQKERLLLVAQRFGLHTQTLRNRFPEIVAQYQRRSPTKPTDPAVVARILELAQNPEMGYRDVAALTGTSFDCVRGICRTHSFVWTPKSKSRNEPRTYQGRKATRRMPQGFRAIENGLADRSPARSDP